MFDSNSRYAKTKDAELVITDKNGETKTLRYKRRRFIPSQTGAIVLVEHTVKEGERLDNITARYLGDPTQFWRICDANGEKRPDDLTATPGRRIRIVMPSP